MNQALEQVEDSTDYQLVSEQETVKTVEPSIVASNGKSLISETSIKCLKNERHMVQNKAK